MISVSHLYTQEETLQEGEPIGLTLAFLKLIVVHLICMHCSRAEFKTYLKNMQEVRDGDYLTMELEVDESQFSPNILFGKLVSSGYVKEFILSNNAVPIIVNKETSTFMKETFKEFPMFRILGTNRSYEATYDKFIRDHSDMIGDDFEINFIHPIRKELKEIKKEDKIDLKNVRYNVEWISALLSPFFGKNNKATRSIKKIKFKANRI